MEKIPEEEENYLPLNINETSLSSPLLSYKINKYGRFYHPIEPSPLIKLQSLENESNLQENTEPSIQDSHLLSSTTSKEEERSMRKEFAEFRIPEEILLSPSPRTKKKNQTSSRKKIKQNTSCFFGLFQKKDSKELKKWWINSPSLSIIATTYQGFKYLEYDEQNAIKKCFSSFKKFPKIEDLSITVDTFAELGPNYTLLLRNILSTGKIKNIFDLRIVSFPGEKTLWHGPAFLFNSVMGFNMKEEDNESLNNRFEIWHRFRAYFDRGAFQEELIELMISINVRLCEEKLHTLHLILASNLRLTDKIITSIEDSLKIFLPNLLELKILLSAKNLTNHGVRRLCERIQNTNPKKIKSFHLFLDYRSPNISEPGVLDVCRTILSLAEANTLEYLSLGFLSNNLRDHEMGIIGDALRLIGKSLRSLVLIISGNMTDQGLFQLVEGVLDGPYLRKICLGFMGSSLIGNKDLLEYLLGIVEKKAKNKSLYLFHLYFNNTKGLKNEAIERLFTEKIGVFKEIDFEGYIFC